MHSSFIATILAFATWCAHAAPVGLTSGWATYYTQQGVAGSCGVYHAVGNFLLRPCDLLTHSLCRIQI
jgi:hypothetical protein